MVNLPQFHDFLTLHGYTAPKAIAQDGSPRTFYRVTNASGGTAILMAMPESGNAPGHNLDDFLRIGVWLREGGLAAPDIYAVDESAGFALMEDFGDLSFKKALGQGAAPERLYGLGAHVLNEIQARDCTLFLPAYEESHVHAGRVRLIDWYVPALTGRMPDAGLRAAYMAAWDAVEAPLPACRQGFLHIDYHTENLMLRAGQEGVKACGILDFQGAMTGPLPYDLVNLLEDARIDASQDLRDFILSHYDETYRLWYRVLGTQFHSRVIGQFIKLAMRGGKTQYLDHIPRLHRYIGTALRDPVLKPLADFCRDSGIDFSNQAPAIDLNRLETLIPRDAF